MSTEIKKAQKNVPQRFKDQINERVTQIAAICMTARDQDVSYNDICNYTVTLMTNELVENFRTNIDLGENNDNEQ